MLSWLHRTLINLHADQFRPGRHDTPAQAARRGRRWSEPTRRPIIQSLDELLEKGAG